MCPEGPRCAHYCRLRVCGRAAPRPTLFLPSPASAKGPASRGRQEVTLLQTVNNKPTGPLLSEPASERARSSSRGASDRHTPQSLTGGWGVLPERWACCGGRWKLVGPDDKQEGRSHVKCPYIPDAFTAGRGRPPCDLVQLLSSSTHMALAAPNSQHRPASGPQSTQATPRQPPPPRRRHRIPGQASGLLAA